MENLTRVIEGDGKGPKLELEVFWRNTIQGRTLSVAFGPVARYLHEKDKFPDMTDSVGRSWLAVGGGVDITFRPFGNILASLRGRYYLDHRTFFPVDLDWSQRFEFGFHLGYGINAVSWGASHQEPGSWVRRQRISPGR